MRPRILKNNLKLSGFQKEVLVGLLLGDGCLERYKNSSGARLKVCQSLKQHEFVEWLYKTFINFVRTPPQIKKAHGKFYEVWFNTLNYQSLRDFYILFYPKRTKIVPKDISELLTPRGLAVWFMSDGSIKSKECKGRILNTHSFDRADIELLVTVLRDKFNLNSSIRTQKDGLQIYISAKSAEVLNDLLKDKILPFFYYKLPLKN